jgi:hypothetical protein
MPVNAQSKSVSSNGDIVKPMIAPRIDVDSSDSRNSNQVLKRGIPVSKSPKDVSSSGSNSAGISGGGGNVRQGTKGSFKIGLFGGNDAESADSHIVAEVDDEHISPGEREILQVYSI